ncbi:SDR family oxidoreductase, partial [Acinetobacter baumannii]|nr:SDR family oxidoreductase [Acinetobacter baumannii]
MNILVTGATGFVGKELLKKLIINPSIDRVTAL